MDYLPEPMLPVTQVRTYGGNAAFHNFHNDYSHISDPNLRRRLALSEIDKVPFGWYHVRAVVVAGIGFFTDSYDIFAINLITSTLGMVYWQGAPIPGSNRGGNFGVLPTAVSTALKAATSGGAVIGQLGFGWLADVVGRRKMYGVELAIIILATLAQALAAPSEAVTLTGLLVYWRVMMGIGIGGDYPLSAIITSEFAPTRWRGAMMAAVFSMQGAGQFAAALVALITTYAFRESFLSTSPSFSSCHEACQLAGDRAWRIIVGFGGVPAIFALYYRITIPETPRYTFDVEHDIVKADADIKAYISNRKEGEIDCISQHQTKVRIGNELSSPKASWPDVFSYFSHWKNAKVLVGTTASWFFLDLAFYGLGLNNSTVLSAIGYSTGDSIYHTLRNTAIGNLILVCAGSIPGYWMSVLTIDTIGRKPIQVFGFLILTIIFSIIGFCYKSLSKGALLALYILAQIFFNFGPNTTTFIVPGECFPTRYRSTGHGVSAASGKIGAIVAQVIAQPLLSIGAAKDCVGHACSPWLDHLMQIFALFMLCGTLFSLLIPETKGRTLEDLAGEPPHALDRDRERSSSEAADGTWRQRSWWKYNVFAGGRPAGFQQLSSSSSSRRGPLSPHLRSKKARVGIMTSPELLPKAHGKGGREGGVHHRTTSEGSAAAATGGGAALSVTNSNGDRDHDHDYNDENGIYVGGGPLPGWGAGWGVQRNVRRDGRVESIQLFDVGKLLK
ncbi:phosphate:h+ symporter [Phlyctema vagabunda]|uniref:Phosphate:h+ symporter n=1 Tax=Phlyctema vagabunda TaxID=108571 RepID=A0ABR4P9P1_9HELO